MPAKKGNSGGGGGGNPPAVPTHSVEVTVIEVFAGEKVDYLLSVFIPFVSKSKIGKCIQGKAEKDSKQPQLGNVELMLDGKKIKVKNPGKTVGTGEKYTVTITSPPKDVVAQLAEGAKAAQKMEDERVQRISGIDEKLKQINESIGEKEAEAARPKNSWMHKDGGDRAKASDRAANVIGHKTATG